MIRIFFFFALLAVGTAAAARMPGLTVSEVWKRHVELDGKVIRVSGVVTECARFGCSLQENARPGARSLGLDGSLAFDGQMQHRLGMPLVIEARLKADCLHSRADREFGDHGRNDIVVCTDRAAVLMNPRIVSSR